MIACLLSSRKVPRAASECRAPRGGACSEKPAGVAEAVGGDDGLIAGGDHEVEVVEPLHGAQGGEAHAAAAVAVVGDFPAEVGVAVAIVGAVNPGTEFVFAPDFGVVAGNDLRETPDAADDFEVVAFGAVAGVGFGPGGEDNRVSLFARSLHELSFQIPAKAGTTIRKLGA